MSEVSTPGSQRTLAGGAQSQPWHALAAEQARVLLEAPEPLTDESARARYERFGPNQLPEGRTSGPLARLGRQLRNFLIYVLLTAAAITARRVRGERVWNGTRVDGYELLGLTFSPTLGYSGEIKRNASTLRCIGRDHTITMPMPLSYVC